MISTVQLNKYAKDNGGKFPSSEEVSQKSVLKYNNENIHVTYSYNEDYKRYVLKDSNGKIRKPINFTSTDLTKYVPEELQKKGIV